MTNTEPVRHTVTGGVAEVVVNRPPVNALRVADWQALARTLQGLGADPEVRVVILAADGRGFNAGVDIKELADDPDHQRLIAVNRACFDAFSAVYHCQVPVIAAVNGYCLGGGIGLAGNADIIVAATDASFGLPEVDRGALGAATHLARMVPQQLMRAMVYTAKPIGAEEMARYGAIYKLAEPDQLRAVAREVAGEIAAKSPVAIRAAKRSLNGIDPIDVDKSYRYEQGFTFELTLAGVGGQARAEFAGKTTNDGEEQ